jgi:ribosome-associated toxin RatA of RatAB toxin-antitoxin module
MSLLVVALPATATARPTLDQERLDLLGHYQVLVFSDPGIGGLERGKAIGVIDATPDEVYRVATDYAKYKDFLPRIKESRVFAGDAVGPMVEIVINLPWPVSEAWVSAKYVHQQLPGEIYRVRFDLLRGSMKRYDGSIYIEPFEDGKTAVTYQLLVDPNAPATDSMINRGVRSTVKSFVQSLRQRINDLHRLGYLHPTVAPAMTPRPSEPPGSRVDAKR